jgi:NADPH-dependent 2,4-dienoyl-CoA reductase/sulfur reductase-like enzyme
MSPADPTFVIVGGGVAGATAALTLRAGGFEGRIVLVGDDPEMPYARPPLSKQIVRGEMKPERVYLRPAKIWDSKEIDFRLGRRVVALDPAAHRLRLEDGEQLAYDKLLLATGGRPRLLPGTEDVPGVRTLRTLADALALREEFARRGWITVVGAGFIGAELAASARTVGCEVTLLEAAPKPLMRVLPPTLAETYAQLHLDRGVDLRTGAIVTDLVSDGGRLRVLDVTGASLTTDTLVVAIGLEPDLALAREAGLHVGDGIIVDELCRTSAPDVFAAGDNASFPHPALGARVRVEHWQNAQHMGQAAARSMLGVGEPFTEVPWVWSDQYDVNLQVAGLPQATDEVVLRGDPESLDFTAFLLRADRLVAAIGVNRASDIRAARALIAEGVTPERHRLSDPDWELTAASAIPAS